MTRAAIVSAGGLRREQGVGLLEILLAVLLISVAFLASAKMQVSSMRNSRDAYYQSQAYLLTNDMIDRMRANVVGVIDGHYDGVSTSGDAPDPLCSESACNVEDQARQDVRDWSAYLHPFDADDFIPLLPSIESVTARGEISRMPDGTHAVRLSWGMLVDGEERERWVSMNFATELPG